MVGPALVLVLVVGDDAIPLQFNMAKVIPGKEEFYETLRYFSRRLQLTEVDVRLNTRVDAAILLQSDPAFDAIVLATGVRPRKLTFEGADHPKVTRIAVLFPVSC